MRKERAKAFRAAAQLAANTATDDQAYDMICVYDAWDGNGVSYALGVRVTRGDVIYSCINGHVSQVDWMPEVAVSLWAIVPESPSVTG